MNKKILSILTAVITVPLVLSGCATINQGGGLYAFDNEYENTSSPQWNKNVADFLAKDGWIVETAQENALKTYNIALPESVYAGNNQNNCSVDYNIDYMPASKEGLPNSSYYMTYKYLNTSLPNQFTKIKIKDTNVQKVKIKGESPIEMLYVSYDFSVPGASGFGEGTDTENFDVPETINGTGKKLTRVFPTPLENPYAKLEKVNLTTKYLAVATLSYTCYGDKMDDKIWDEAVASAELNFDALPKVSGDPIIPERRNPSEVKP